MQRVFNLLIKGIGAALTCFTFGGIIWDAINGGNYALTNWAYTKMVIGCVIVGIGFSLPAFIYYNPTIPYAIKVIFHMGIGSAIFLVTAFIVGWIPVQLGIGKCILIVAAELSLSVILWIIFVGYYKKMAHKMNQKIKNINKNTNIDHENL